MSFFSNKTNTNTTATTENAATDTTQETTNGGGLFKGVCIAVGTAVGIGAAIVGGKKAYKYFHRDEEIIDSDDDFEEEGFDEDDDFVEEPVEDFKEVDTEVTVNSETVKAEEAKTDENVNETPAEAEATENNETVKAEEAKTENPVNPEPSKKEAAPLVEKMGEYLKVFDAKMFNPLEIKLAINHIDELVGRIAGCHRTIGDNCKIETFINKFNKGLEKFWVDMYGEILEYNSRNEDVHAIFDDPIRMVDWAYNNMHYINRNTTVVDASAETIKLYKRFVSEAEKPAVNKPSAGENQTAENCFDVFKEGHKESNKVEGETKTSTKSSDENQKLMELIHKCTGEIPVTHPEKVDVQFYIRCMGGYLQKLDRTSLSKDELRQLNEECEDMTKSVRFAISNIARNKCDDIDDVISSIDRIHKIENELLASKIMDSSTSPNIEKKYFDKRVKRACEKLNDIKEKLTAGETKTAEPVVDEKQATTKESPSETQIGNSTVISDDGETVTLKASVSEESVQNVKDVIDIVSKIPNREDPEKNDMPYYIRVIGSRIAGITEPEATFLAYNDKTKSNDFIDACVSLCNMVGNGICNLADQKSDPIGSLGWINRSYDELIASGVIDNTYNPQAMRDALTKARNEATRVLANMVKKSDETRADDNSSNETQVEEPLTFTMSEKIQEAVQQSDETAATTEPETESHAPMSPEASSLAAKLQEVGNLMRAKKWSDVSEFYKTQLTPYLADDGLSKELRDEIMGIKTKATNMMMSQKQLEAKQKAASAKASKKASKKRRRH